MQFATCEIESGKRTLKKSIAKDLLNFVRRCIDFFRASGLNETRVYASFLGFEHGFTKSTVQVPAFQSLTFLALGLLTIQGWKLLASLLSSAPNLETLQLEEGFHEYEEGFATFESSLPTLPVSLELKLKEINVWVFKGEEDEMKLIEYFLKNGNVLEKLNVHRLLYDDITTLVRLYMFPRRSNTCKVVFLGKEGCVII